MTLTWTPPEGTVTGYQILRIHQILGRWEPQELAPGCDDGMVVHVNDTGSDAATYTDTDVAVGVTYSYRVKAINSNGVGQQSSSADRKYVPQQLWPYGFPFTPGAPTNLESEYILYGNQFTGIELTWDAAGR